MATVNVSPVFGDWTAYTPTLSGIFTNGDWTKTCRYMQIGKMVIVQIHLVAADATPMGGAGAATLTLPVTAASYSGTAGSQHLGQAMLIDVTGAYHLGNVAWASTTTASIFASRSSNTYTDMLNPTSTIPFTWTTSDEIHSTFIYEAA